MDCAIAAGLLSAVAAAARVEVLRKVRREVEAQFAEWLESQRGASMSSDAIEEGQAVGSEGAEGAGGLPFPRAVIAATTSSAPAQ